MPTEQPKQYDTRDSEGRVKTAPRKIYTNKSKKGNGFWTFLKCPYWEFWKKF